MYKACAVPIAFTIAIVADGPFFAPFLGAAIFTDPNLDWRCTSVSRSIDGCSLEPTLTYGDRNPPSHHHLLCCN